MSTAVPPTLRTLGLTVREGRELLLDGVDLEVRPGEIHGLVGPNGAGKTTLLSCVLGARSFMGQIHLEGPRTPRLAYVPQDLIVDRLLPLTVVELLALPLQRRPVWLGVSSSLRERIDQALEAVDLIWARRRVVGELSGGERQRVLLALALLREADLLLLDEPARGLDRVARARLGELIAAQAAGGAGVLLVSHDAPLVRERATRITVLDVTIRAAGPPAEILGAYLAGEVT